MLAKLGVTLDLTRNPTRIAGEIFESLTTAGAVLERATEIFQAIETAADSDPNMRCSLGWRVFERIDDGSEQTHAFGTAHAVGHAIATACGTVQVNPEISPEERAAKAARQREAEYQARLRRVATRAISSLRSAAVARVQRLLRDPTSSVHTMNTIAEIVEHDLEGKLGKLRLQSQFDRFNASINHPAIMGENARHAVAKAAPHPDPMSLEEAQAFIRELAERWFVLHADDSATDRPI